MITELRARTRMPTANLKSSIRVSKGILKDIWEEARAKDFSFFGMCLKTNRIFEVDDVITLSLNLELDVGNIGVAQINARIARINKLVGFYEYGVEFDKKVIKNPTGSTAKDLLRIENFLTRQAALTARLSEQKIA
ncbi:MAG: PilZ domain-containing protein [Hahellaceae bacterium]|nr:PilZ domain-containing protein [Hahellaceae bacterium]MCP5168875.1 PilZ domain-containing protein [Hahellaceae bacterium]